MQVYLQAYHFVNANLLFRTLEKAVNTNLMSVALYNTSVMVSYRLNCFYLPMDL